jgi:cell division protein FtsB
MNAMKVDLGIWDKLTRLVLFLLFIAGLLLVGVWYLPLIRTNERMRKQIVLLDAQTQKAEENRKQLLSSIQTLGSDQKAMERLIRERLGYAKTGETVIRFEVPSTPRAGTTPTNPSTKPVPQRP